MAAEACWRGELFTLWWTGNRVGREDWVLSITFTAHPKWLLPPARPLPPTFHHLQIMPLNYEPIKAITHSLDQEPS
jgi:hypothetical protein